MPPHQADGRDDARLCADPRARANRPRDAADEPRNTKNERVHPAEIGNAPITRSRNNARPSVRSGAGNRLRHASAARQRQPEHAEAVRHTDAEVNRPSAAGRYEPPFESRVRQRCVPDRASLATAEPRLLPWHHRYVNGAGAPSPPTDFDRVVHFRKPKRCVVSSSSGKRCDASC
jgi:hypothetical protein